jgi:D-beta-D-heptose 7-phosphate kinase/D-beta-D-heptose 1-phosphate adenosyltransferase
MLTRNRVDHLLAAFTGKAIAVVGDIMLDEFVWGKVRRISPEAPVPVIEVIEETYRLGGAANVAANIRALGGRPLPVGVIGQDRGADLLVHLLQETDIATEGLVQDHRPTTLKTRIIAHHQQVARTDREQRTPLTAPVNDAVTAAFERALAQSQAVIVSDYDKGVANRHLLSTILPLARAAAVPVFLDPKVHHADYYRPITTITPNHAEAELLSGMSIDSSTALEEAGIRLLQKFDCQYVLITRGEEGMSLFSRAGSHHLPTFAREVFDVTGAGDTVIATLALANAGGGTMEESAILANHAAGIVVGKIGTATVNRSELLTDFDSRDAHSAG